MRCLCRDEQIVNVSGRSVLLKGVNETFHFARLTRGQNHDHLGPILVKALRDVGNHIPPDAEEAYGRILAEVFGVYCAVEPWLPVKVSN